MSTDQPQLHAVGSTHDCALYQLADAADSGVRRWLASTPETRAVCNDPAIVGVDYTTRLQDACSRVLGSLAAAGRLAFVEQEAVVLHILRGGLNFGLRQALHDALRWNDHASAFISAQRARVSDRPQDWYITERAYRKVYMPRRAAIVFGDVVATGTSLLYALRQILDCVDAQQSEIGSILFFCLGGPRAEAILIEIDQLCRDRFAGYRGADVVYLEGRFTVARTTSPVTIKLDGTDLLRRDAVLSPEFIASQYDAASYPLERCTIYDAGSRAFWLPEYFDDVRHYWQQTAALAAAGTTFGQLLAERLPELDPAGFGAADLAEVCAGQLARLPALR